jgi:hypothetical protein
VRWVVFYGAIPLLHSDLAPLCRLLTPARTFALRYSRRGICRGTRCLAAVEDLVDDIHPFHIDAAGESHE